MSSGLRRRSTQILWVLIDILLMQGSVALAATLVSWPISGRATAVVWIIIATRVVLFVKLGMYRAVLRYSGIHALVSIAGGIFAGTATAVVVAYFLRWPDTGGTGRSFLVPEALISLGLCGGARLVMRLYYERQSGRRRAVILGAGELAAMVMRTLRHGGEHQTLGFLDERRESWGSIISGRPVLGGLDQLEGLARKRGVDLLVVASPDMQGDALKRVFSRCMALGMQVKVVKGTGQMLDAGSAVVVDDLALEDLLRRPVRQLDERPVQAMLAGKCVLVTGAGGSIGSELCRQIATQGVAALVLVEASEPNLYLIHDQLVGMYPTMRIAPVLLDIKDREATAAVFLRHRPDVVFHAAACKHVHLVELNPAYAIRNNVGGLRNVLDAAQAAGCARLVLISTDKAVRPTNVMGATKRVCELLLQSRIGSGPTLCAVRFGNVLGSSGSVVPKFLAQIRAGGPVTVTHADVTRYFMLIPEAATLVLHAGALAEGGEVFILDMGEPVRIADLARQLIWMTGHVPDGDVTIAYSGLRPGEKLYEELIKSDSERGTAVEGVTVARSARVDAGTVAAAVERLLSEATRDDSGRLLQALAALVPEWTPSEYMLGHDEDAVPDASEA
ncbi:MAG: polysaccharide biosynthesis protein [Planctomycetes bacterium]|nr:polysaccharide biosynthesis protein [Planctomycetota bacterium]